MNVLIIIWVASGVLVYGCFMSYAKAHIGFYDREDFYFAMRSAMLVSVFGPLALLTILLISFIEWDISWAKRPIFALRYPDEQ